ncbi:MAG: phosphotransferase [Chloroflexota bacterium]
MNESIHPTYLQQIKQFYPDVTTDSLRVISDGLVNIVVIVNAERVFRFPRNDEWAMDLLRHEMRVLDLLRKHMTLSIPDCDIVTDDFVSYPLVQGDPCYRWDLLRLPDYQQDRLAEQLAEFLTQMHGIPLDRVRTAGIGDSDVNRTREVRLKLFADVQAELYPHMMPYSRDWVEAHFAPLLNDERFMAYNPVLINGDLSCYHILWDKPTASLTGIIDFGTAGIGDPAADYGCLINTYGESFLARVAKYDSGVEATLDRARFWAGALELQWLLAGIRQNDPSWHTAHIGNARDVAPIGTP